MKKVLFVLLVLVVSVFGQGSRPPPNSIVAILGAPAARGISTTTYFALRTDTLPGSGTAEDPFNAGGASNAAKAVALDTKLHILPNNAHIVLMGGPTAVFWTNGLTSGLLGFDTKEGWWISGGGATLKLASTNSGVVIGSNLASVHHVLIEDLVVDANWAGLINNTTTNAVLANVVLNGSYNTVKNVHAFNAYGHTSECFAMVLGSGGSSSVEAATDNWFIDCTAETPHGDYVDAFCLFGVNEDQAPGHHFPISHSGAIRCRAMGAWNQGFASAWADDITISECKALGTQFGYYDDTGFNDELHIDNCYFDSTARAIMWNGSGDVWVNDHLFITNNTIHCLGAAVSLYGGNHNGVVITGNRLYAGHVDGNQDGVDVFVGTGQVITNVKIAGNTFYTGDFGCIISQAVSSFIIEGNNFYDGFNQAVQLATLGGGLSQGINQVIQNNTITTHNYGITSQDAVPTGVTIKGNHVTGIGGSSVGIHLNSSGGHFITDNVLDTATPIAGVSATNFTQQNHKSDGTVVGTPSAVSIVEGGTGNVSSFVQTTSGTFSVPSGTRLVRSTNTSSVTFNLPVIGSSHPTGMDILVRNEAGGGTGVVVKDSGGSTVATVGVLNTTRFVPTVAPSTWVSYPSSTSIPVYNGQSQSLSGALTLTTSSGKDFKVGFGGGTILDVGTNGSVAQLSFFGAALAAKPTGDILTALTTLNLVGSPTIAFADVTGLGTAAALNTGTSSGNIPLLDGSGKIPSSELPASSTTFKGVWNANTNSPTITSSSGTLGWFYLVNTAGATTIDGISSWAVGDQIIFDGSVWKQVSAASLVTSVAGRTGAVTIAEADVTDATALGRSIGKVTSLSALSLLRLNADDSVTARSYANFKVDLSLDNVANTTDITKQVASSISLNSGPSSTNDDLIVANGDSLDFKNYTAVTFGSGKAALFRTAAGFGSIALQSDTSTSTAIQKGNGTGGFTPAAASTDYIAATSGSAIQKASSGGLVAAVASTDYISATSGSAIQKASSGGLAAAVTGTDFVGVPVVTTVAFGSTVTPAVGTTGNTTTYVIGALTNNIIIGAPTGTPKDGQILKFRFSQDGTGSRSVTWNSAFVFGTDITAAMEPTAASAIWRRAFEWNAATSKWECTGLVRGF